MGPTALLLGAIDRVLGLLRHLSIHIKLIYDVFCIWDILFPLALNSNVPVVNGNFRRVWVANRLPPVHLKEIQIIILHKQARLFLFWQVISH
jgi:hypothetical protein